MHVLLRDDREDQHSLQQSYFHAATMSMCCGLHYLCSLNSQFVCTILSELMSNEIIRPLTLKYESHEKYSDFTFRVFPD